jgi:hypothetical protein
MQSEYSPEVVARFWSRVNRTGNCWLWTASTISTGYGQTWDGEQNVLAHRFAYQLASSEPLPKGMFILHTCDARACVRNDEAGTYEINGVLLPRFGHLVLGTHSDNMRDMLAKGRGIDDVCPERRPSGDRNGARLYPERISVAVRRWAANHPERVARGERKTSAKLTESDVREIRRAYAAGEATQSTLGVRFGVSQVKISQVVLRKNWTHID